METLATDSGEPGHAKFGVEWNNDGLLVHVIVSDWKMPGLNGVRLYEHLVATKPAMAPRVLFMTGDMVNESFQDFLREHNLTCLSKPFATREFRAAVAKLFGT